MQRYGFELVVTGPKPEPYSSPPTEWQLTEKSDGEYVLHSDAQSALLAKDRDCVKRCAQRDVEIAELREALQILVDWDAKYPKGREWQYGMAAQIERELDAICVKARQALSRDGVNIDIKNKPVTGWREEELLKIVASLVAAFDACLVMFRSSKPKKLDEALTWIENDEKALKMASEALAKGRAALSKGDEA